MDNTEPVDTIAIEAAPDERASIGELLSRLVEELRAWFEAEFAVYRAEATRRSLSAGVAAGLLIGALALAQGALVALLVGLIILIAPDTGTGYAIVIVVGITLLLVALLAWLGVRQIAKIIDPDKPS
jgi:hypothetical protein